MASATSAAKRREDRQGSGDSEPAKTLLNGADNRDLLAILVDSNLRALTLGELPCRQAFAHWRRRLR
jgi:hypothetical protein